MTVFYHINVGSSSVFYNFFVLNFISKNGYIEKANFSKKYMKSLYKKFTSTHNTTAKGGELNMTKDNNFSNSKNNKNEQSYSNKKGASSENKKSSQSTNSTNSTDSKNCR